MNNRRTSVKSKEIGIAILAGMVIIAASYYATNWLLFDDEQQKQSQLNGKVVRLRTENDHLEEVRKNFTRLSLESSKAQEQYNELKSLIPEEKDVTKILDWVAADARGRNLKLEHFSQNAHISKGGLIEVPIIVGVNGDIDQIRRFSEDIARYERLLRIESIKIEGKLPSTAAIVTQTTDPNEPIKTLLQGDGIMTATLSISAFVGDKLIAQIPVK